MIGFLHGHVAYKDSPFIYLNVNGVGYKILSAKDLLSKNYSPDESVTIFTYTYVKEDVLELFGFSHIDDLKLFEKLITIQGIGPRTAIQVFSVGGRNEIVSAIINTDIEFFTSVPRLGRKNAQKIILELKSKFIKGDNDLSVFDTHQTEVYEALLNMGISTNEVRKVLFKIQLPQDIPIEEQIKQVLKALSK